MKEEQESAFTNQYCSWTKVSFKEKKKEKEIFLKPNDNSSLKPMLCSCLAFHSQEDILLKGKEREKQVMSGESKGVTRLNKVMIAECCYRLVLKGDKKLLLMKQTSGLHWKVIATSGLVVEWWLIDNLTKKVPRNDKEVSNLPVKDWNLLNFHFFLMESWYTNLCC